MIRPSPLLIAACLAAPVPAAAQEAWVGIYKHGVNTPFTFSTGEGGIDLQAGLRLAPLEALGVIGKPSPYLIASVNTGGDTSFAGAGLSWKIGKGPVFVRPGVGLVVHTAPAYRVDAATRTRTDLGSRVLFEPELAVGTHLTPRTSVEASWTHISNAQLFNGEQNPGIDMFGIRLTHRLR